MTENTTPDDEGTAQPSVPTPLEAAAHIVPYDGGDQGADDRESEENDGALKALRAERQARKQAERQARQAQEALQAAQQETQIVRHDLFEMRFSKVTEPMCEYPELLRKIGEWADTMTDKEIHEQATELLKQYPKLANTPVDVNMFTRMKPNLNVHTLNAQMFQNMMHDELNR